MELRDNESLELRRRVADRDTPGGLQRRTEQALQHSETRFRLLAENAADVIWTVDIRSPDRVTYISPSVTRLLGYSVDEAMSKTWNDVFTPESVRVTALALQEELGRGGPGRKSATGSRTLELELVHKNGSTVAVEVNYSLLPGDDGLPVEILAVVRDISGRKQAERELGKYREDLETMVKQRTEELELLNWRLQQEITERRNAEGALRESEERFRNVLENSLDAAYRRDLQTDRYD